RARAPNRLEYLDLVEARSGTERLADERAHPDLLLPWYVLRQGCLAKRRLGLDRWSCGVAVARYDPRHRRKRRRGAEPTGHTGKHPAELRSSKPDAQPGANRWTDYSQQAWNPAVKGEDRQDLELRLNLLLPAEPELQPAESNLL